MKKTASLVSALALLILAMSCSKESDFGFKELCFYHPHTAPVRVNVDWSSFSHIEQPTGMTVYVWPQNGEDEVLRFVTHDLDAVTLDLEAGRFHSFVFNQSDSEYATLEFHNLEDLEKAEVRVKHTKAKSEWYFKSDWYNTKNPETKLGTEPEWLAIDCLRDIEVTEEMVEIAEKEFLEGRAEAQAKARGVREITRSQHDVGTLTPKSIIKNVDVYVHMDNIKFLGSASAALEDMAEGCLISSGETTEGRVTHTIEAWSLIYDGGAEGEKRNGAIKATLSTFGAPAGHKGVKEDNILYVRLLLTDKETVMEMSFPVGDQLADINTYDGTRLDEDGKPVWPEIHVYWPEPLPDVTSKVGEDGAFDVGVGGWGEEIVTVLPLI